MSGQTTGVLSRLRQPVGAQHRTHQLVGGLPQVSLLPGEVREAGAVSAHRRRLIAVVVVAALLAAGGVAAAQSVETAAQERLARSQSQSVMLNTQVAKFNDVRALEQQIALGKAAVKVGSSTLIDWNAQVGAIEANMPIGYSVAGISASGATPVDTYAQGVTLLEPTRAATVVMTVTTTTFDDRFSTWLRMLRTLPVYADVSADTNYSTTDGTYTIVLTMHLNAKAISAGSWTEKP